MWREGLPLAMSENDRESKLRAAREDAQHYQSRLESILDNIVDGLVTIDEFGRIQSFNKACEKMFGYTASEAIGQNIKMLMPTPYAENHDQYLQNYRETGREKIIGIGREVEARRKDGTVFPIDLAVAELQIGDQRLFSGIIRDITEKKKSEQFVGLLAAIVQSSEDAIISKSLDGVITSWNAGAEKLFGYAAEEVIGRHISMIIPEDRLPEEDSIIRQLRQGKRVDHYDTVRRRKDGADIRVSLTVSPIFDPSGRIIGASKMARDLTERLLQDERMRQTQKMEAVGQLTSGVAHDFNNLLTVVLGNTRLIRKRMKIEPPAPVFADIAERIDDIDVAAQRGADLVRRLMVFTRQRPLQKTVVNLNTCIDEAAGLLTRAVSERVQLKTVFGADVWPVIIDQDQFVNGLINLAVNARDAMQGGGIFCVETRNVVLGNGQYPEVPLPAGEYVLITVSDTGAGMPAEVRQRIFEPFFTTKPAGEGTGLGLSMVYGLIQQSSGHIEVDSEVGGGTAFRIYLPAHRAETQP